MSMTVYYLFQIIRLVLNNINDYQEMLTGNRDPILGRYLLNLMCENYATEVGRVNKKPNNFIFTLMSNKALFPSKNE